MCSFARSFPGLQGQKDIELCVLLSKDNERPRTAEPLRQFPSAHGTLKYAKKCNLWKSHSFIFFLLLGIYVYFFNSSRDNF